MSPGPPAVTVVVAAYNHAAYVEQALQSVADQTFQDFQFIIFDDASTDGTPDRIRAWMQDSGREAAFIAHTVNVGICAVWNAARRLAQAPLICVLAGDDWFEVDRLETQVPFLSAQPDDVGFVYSNVRLVDDDGVPYPISYLDFTLGQRPRPQGWILDQLLRENVIPAPGVLVRVAALDAIGGLDESLAFEDDDMWLRICEKYQATYLPAIVANKRGLASSLGIATEWSSRIEISRLAIDLKWLGKSADWDRLLSMRLLARATQTMRSNRAAAKDAIAQVATRSQDPLGRSLARLMRVPGVTAAAGALVRLRRRLIRRHPGNSAKGPQAHPAADEHVSR